LDAASIGIWVATILDGSERMHRVGI